MSLDLGFDFDCEHCGKVISVDDTLAGSTMTCPGCEHQLVVPGASAALARAAMTRATRPCPHCGKPIGAIDERCRHCKGWTGAGKSPEATRALVKHEHRTSGKGSIRPTALDYTLAVLFPWAAAPLSVVYLLGGQNRRGMVLLMLSLALCVVQLAGVEYGRQHWPQYFAFLGF